MFSPWDLTDVDGTLYFNADDTIGNRQQLWKTDGTPDGTLALGRSAGDLTNVNGTLFFTRGRFSGGTIVYELWKSDAAGTVFVKDIAPDSEPSGVFIGPSALTNVNGTLFFIAQYSTYESALWKSDGTAAGTHIVKDIEPGAAGSDPSELADVGGKLLFTACDDVAGCEP